MKKLVCKENGKYRIIKADIPYNALSTMISRALYDVVQTLGAYQELEESKKLLQLPYAIGDKVKIEYQGFSCKAEITEITLTIKEIMIVCTHKSGMTISIPQKDWETSIKECIK